MMIKYSILLFSVLFFSCDNSSYFTEKTDTKTNNKTDSKISENRTVRERDTTTWDQYSEKLFAKYKTRIDISDIEMAITVLKKEKLIDPNIKINNSSNLSFCYHSPSAMFGNIIRGNNYSWPDSAKVMTIDDQKFIFNQQDLRGSNYFKWQYLTKQFDTTSLFPQYQISLPVFSLDKKKFIICIDKYSADNNLIDGVSYLFIIYEKSARHFVFDRI